ncbi:isoprenoid biosynthesis protein ElbB [Coraliomargarita sinensis]|uniref:Isoprenoid biosynthesis protein ElbB n=1 Tax=Coraliomargarita sinensis TaxID=2174842 RepID=A0A317ZF40_9BACT|nr:isoprenoid biosynthesis glyoxalase ElbB [Coraliomargarita sinensis]PXA02967.1 isoprenoid biosynthesis protein ElbB [Coraliomargarita sinensis]
MKKVAVILSGCGAYDGAEIQEAVLTLLALDRAKAEVTCAAPEIAQKHVINHITGEEMVDEDRSVITEASRITRGNIQSLDTIQSGDFDAIIFVGGFGVAKNLSSYAFDGPDYDIDPEVLDLIHHAHAEGKALGFMCISPVLAARALGEKGVQLTIGNDRETAAALEAKGAKHVDCPVDEAVTDKENRVVTTPAYMLAQSITDAEAGINKLVASVLEMA